MAAALERRDASVLSRAPETDAGRLSHPTTEHYLPLLYIAGLQMEGETLGFPARGIDLGTISMLSVQVG